MRALALAVLAFAAFGCDTTACRPGTQRGCLDGADGAAQQPGYQACSASGEWSACYAVGACVGGASTRQRYARCDSDAQCGDPQCAVCGRYSGVTNPAGAGICHSYCQQDADCATGEGSGLTPRCILGQCGLFCDARSRCPFDSQCLAWANSAIAAAYPAFQGLCQ
ncbi:MAG: hypothetical protein JNK72_14605 [Myxococcales bacterium]|nr:hypothetical protein [Myxococcales bacterium]